MADVVRNMPRDVLEFCDFPVAPEEALPFSACAPPSRSSVSLVVLAWGGGTLDSS